MDSVIESLIKYIKEIFETKNINGSFEVYEIHDKSIPPFLDGLSSRRKYVVCTDASDEESEKILKRFTKKDITRIDDHLIWFEGDNFDTPEELKVEINKLNKYDAFPEWIDNYIFNTCGATYQRDSSVSSNKNNSHEKNLNYLGTYFPRSFAESYCICENIFGFRSINSKYHSKKNLKILSVGCGTGGDAIGIIQIAKKMFSHLDEVELVAIDVNEDATSILKKLVAEAQQNLEIKISVTCIFCDFLKNGFSSDQLAHSVFDVIVSSKMINELISEKPIIPYYFNFLLEYARLLSENGILIVSDITTYSKNSRAWFPELLNKQVNQFLTENSNEFCNLIPICCVKNGINCQGCYSQIRFYVSHSAKKSDETKISYRVIVRKRFYEKIGITPKIANYKISDTAKYCKNHNCVQLTEIADGFDLTNGYRS